MELRIAHAAVDDVLGARSSGDVVSAHATGARPPVARCKGDALPAELAAHEGNLHTPEYQRGPLRPIKSRASELRNSRGTRARVRYRRTANRCRDLAVPPLPVM